MSSKQKNINEENKGICLLSLTNLFVAIAVISDGESHSCHYHNRSDDQYLHIKMILVSMVSMVMVMVSPPLRRSPKEKTRRGKDPGQHGCKTLHPELII